MELQCSLDEMEIDKSHMGTLLQFLTNYSDQGYVFGVMVICYSNGLK